MQTAPFTKSIILVVFSQHQMYVTMSLATTTVPKFHFFGGSYGTFWLTENPMLKAQVFTVPPWCKQKTILSVAH